MQGVPPAQTRVVPTAPAAGNESLVLGAGGPGGIRPPAYSRMQAPLTPSDAYHRAAGGLAAGQSDARPVTHPGTRRGVRHFMLNVHILACHDGKWVLAVVSGCVVTVRL